MMRFAAFVFKFGEMMRMAMEYGIINARVGFVLFTSSNGDTTL